MKEDKLEELLKNNKQQLDFDEPNDELIWKGISSELNSKKSQARLVLSWAAVLVPLVGLGIYFLSENIKPDNPQDEMVYSLSDLGPEWKELEANYEADIEDKMLLINEQAPGEKLEMLMDQLKILDEVNLQYRKDIPSVNDERLINTLIDYYEKKTRILEKILMEIEREKRHENENRNYEI